MKFIRNLFLLLVFAGGALYFTNPDQAAFSAWLSVYVQNELADDEPGESELGKKFRRGLGQIAGAAGGKMAERQDLTVASLYTIEIAGESHIFVGVAGQFFALKGA